ncbi:response regulator [Longimicrobium sp.]|uniref:response regulator n=1 Tax=Longimicrobium sp. TaxID=2029185 RepID=UPI002C16928C|nr:response regulator [Longimicrobium sp.]HSU17338.1 response regulator [Longimicrobium sp.]
MSRRILIVDDEDDIREVAQMSLEMVAGWEVIPASSGEEGIRLAAEHRPDAILLDVMMPGMDGPATAQRLGEDAATSAIPIILLTAKVQAADRRRFEGLGVAGVLAKPFDPMDLARQVSASLGWPE